MLKKTKWKKKPKAQFLENKILKAEIKEKIWKKGKKNLDQTHHKQDVKSLT